MPVSEDTTITPAADTKSESWKADAFDAAVKLAIPVLLAMCSWLFSEVQGLKDTLNVQAQRIAVIEATRFTKDDGDARLEKINDALSRLEVLTVRAAAETKALSDKVTRLEAQLDHLGKAKGQPK